jgi:hypothetical protein
VAQSFARLFLNRFFGCVSAIGIGPALSHIAMRLSNATALLSGIAPRHLIAFMRKARIDLPV